jgi:DNA-binding transcriptional MerR regulator
MFFKIGEVSQLTGVKPYVLRYWESEFKLIRPQKSKIGQRVYRRREVELILRLKQLLYEERYTIEGAKKKITQEIKEEKARRYASPQPGELTKILQRELKSLISMLKE